MALTQTDKDTISRIARKEVKDFMSKPQFRNEIESLVTKQLKSNKKLEVKLLILLVKLL